MTRMMDGLVVAAVLTAATPALSHHAFSAEFDHAKPMTLTGTISKVLWANPHAWIYIDVKDADGKVVEWGFEMTAANNLFRRGWRPADVLVGTRVTIDGWPARNGSPKANAGRILLPDGREFFSEAPGQPAAQTTNVPG
ncbi:MAG: hypothetical protein EXQ48_09100 [Acidobacteria bacterium]|nr:hypothetical protein [Acidobacteriota bacterium]